MRQGVVPLTSRLYAMAIPNPDLTELAKLPCLPCFAVRVPCGAVAKLPHCGLDDIYSPAVQGNPELDLNIIAAYTGVLIRKW